MEAAFGQIAPVPRQLPSFDIDYGLDNWSPGLLCDRNEPCEKPQLLPGEDIYIDIGDSMSSSTIELRTESPDSENEHQWFGPEGQSSGSDEDFQAHDPAISSK